MGDRSKFVIGEEVTARIESPHGGHYRIDGIIKYDRGDGQYEVVEMPNRMVWLLPEDLVERKPSEDDLRHYHHLLRGIQNFAIHNTPVTVSAEHLPSSPEGVAWTLTLKSGVREAYGVGDTFADAVNHALGDWDTREALAQETG